MENKKIVTTLVLLIILVSVMVTVTAIFSNEGIGRYAYQSIRGQEIQIYGKGLYKDMSADVAVQGIAQDWITLCIAVPILIFALILARKDSTKGKLLLSGTAAYFFVTYLFYTAMAMYNKMFLAYVFLLGASFFTFILTLFSIELAKIKTIYQSSKIMKIAGIFLMVNSFVISMLWLSIVLPPFFDGTIIPKSVENYTTLIVQGFDLGLLLPIAFVSGLLAIRKNVYGYLFTIVNVVLLSLLMTALTSKIAFMANAGQNVLPVIFIIPTVEIIAIFFSVLLLTGEK